MNGDAPTLQEIIQLTHGELITVQEDDPIRECGRAALSLLPSNPQICLELAYQKLHDVPYNEVKTCWRRLYTDASLWKALDLATRASNDEQTHLNGHPEGWIDEVVRLLDMALILAGAPSREEVVELWFAALKRFLPLQPSMDLGQDDALGRPTKRRKVSSSDPATRMPPLFPIALPERHPALRCPIPRSPELSISAFQKLLDNAEAHTPIIIEDAIQHWPALEERPWNNPSYLLEQTLGGRRLVPVEIGKSYTDETWGQRIVTFNEFMNKYILGGPTQCDCDQEGAGGEHEGEGNDLGHPYSSPAKAACKEETRQTGYLAQHDLFAQIPSLRADISIPDYCYCEPASSPHLKHIKPTPKLEEPLLNAWFGPAGTVSPLHTDPYHNILAQVVGYKYVRLYAPEETKRLYPRSVDDNGIDMSNTSEVDLDEAMAVYPKGSCWAASDDEKEDMKEGRIAFESQFPSFKDAKYIEGILGPGECLYLPVGWWHYVTSLTPSFSVSFWFN